MIHCSAVATRDVARRLDGDARGVRARDHVVERQQRVAGSGGSSWNTSMPAPAIAPLVERVVQRGLVVHRPARGRDEERARLHARELLATHEPFGLGRQRTVEVHEVGPLEQLVELDLRRTPRRGLARPTGTGRTRARSSRTARTARPAGHRSARRRRCRASCPAARCCAGASGPGRPPPDHAVGQHDLLGQREHETQRVLGDRFATGTGVVAHDHPGRGARVDVDDVVARARRAHREQVGATRQERRCRRSTARPRRDCAPARCGSATGTRAPVRARPSWRRRRR